MERAQDTGGGPVCKKFSHLRGGAGSVTDTRTHVTLKSLDDELLAVPFCI